MNAKIIKKLLQVGGFGSLHYIANHENIDPHAKLRNEYNLSSLVSI